MWEKLQLDVWPRHTHEVKIKVLFSCRAEWAKWTRAKRGTIGPIYQK